MANITVIGIDPGSQHTGFGVIREEANSLQLLECGVINTDSSQEFAERLTKIYRELSSVITRNKPQEAAVEQVFVAKNAQSALKLGQ
ncbi:MAG: crossover junction endodeoxyribonuclease RuvC, partial [Desulfovibrionaceae bacterium]|nr:crossover junction endodeoxyribonuclease RuvC [Desulfovibrionaceae bacterium]